MVLFLVDIVTIMLLSNHLPMDKKSQFLASLHL